MRFYSLEIWLQEFGFSFLWIHTYLRSLHSSIPDFMEILVGLISDEYTNVANKSRKILNIFTHTHLGPECRPLVEMLEENLHNLSTSLPRIIRCVGKIVFNKFYQLYAKDRSRLLYKLNFTILIISLVIELYFKHYML